MKYHDIKHALLTLTALATMTVTANQAGNAEPAFDALPSNEQAPSTVRISGVQEGKVHGQFPPVLVQFAHYSAAV